MEYMTIFSVFLFIIVLLMFLFFSSMKKIPPSQALIKTSVWSKHDEICRHSAFVSPVSHHLEYIDLSTKEIVVELLEHESLRCKDGIRIEIKVEFKVGVHSDEQHIRSVAEKFDDCRQTFNLKAVEDYLKQSLFGALKSTAQNMNMDKFTQNDDVVKEQIFCRLGNDTIGEEIDEIVIFGGYQIYDVSILLSSALDRNAYNPDDPEDARGLQKIDQMEHDAKLKFAQMESDAKLNQQRIEDEEKKQEQDLKFAAKQKEQELFLQTENLEADKETQAQDLKLAAKKKEQELFLQTEKLAADKKIQAQELELKHQQLEYTHQAEKHALYLKEAEIQVKRDDADYAVRQNTQQKEQALALYAQKLKQEQKKLEQEVALADEKLKHELALASQQQEQEIAIDSKKLEYTLKEKEHQIYIEESDKADKRQEADNLVKINTQRLEQELALEAQKLKQEQKKQEQEVAIANEKLKHEFALASKKQEQELELERQKLEYNLKTEVHQLYLEESDKADKRQEADNLVKINTQKREQELVLEAQKLKDEHDAHADDTRIKKLGIEHNFRLFELDREQNLKTNEIKGKITFEKKRQELTVIRNEAMGLSTKVAIQSEANNIADAKANRAVEIQNAKAQKEIEQLRSETEAQKQLSSYQGKIQAKVLKIKELAEAKLEAAQFNIQTAEKESQVILKMAEAEAAKGKYEAQVSIAEAEVGKTEAEVLLEKVKAENAISDSRINAEIIRDFIPLVPEIVKSVMSPAERKIDIIQDFIPLLPKIVESLMSPAEKIDSIKFLNINGLEGLNNSQGNPNQSQGTNSPFFNTLLHTILNAGMLWPVVKEVVSAFKKDNNQNDILDLVKNIPGGEMMLEMITEKFSDQEMNQNKKDVGSQNE